MSNLTDDFIMFFLIVCEQIILYKKVSNFLYYSVHVNDFYTVLNHDEIMTFNIRCEFR